MKPRIVRATTIACLLGIVLTSGQPAKPQAAGRPAQQGASQPPPAKKELMAEDVYKNIQVLKGLPENQFLATMGFFSASIGESCEFCHDDESSWAGYAKDNANKQTARKMVLMMRAINQSYFGGQREVTCYSCHRGMDRPKVTPIFAEQYTTPPPEDPDVITEEPAGAPSADQILDKYLQALGGAQKLASMTSYVEKGTYQGFAEVDKSAIEIMAKAPGQRTTIIHTPTGDWTTAYDGRAGWVAEPGRPVPLLELTGQFLDSVKADADLSFPGRIKQSFSKWLVGGTTTINDRDAQIVQGMSSGDFPVKLYFDTQTWLLLRQIRYTNSPIGLNPTQTDYLEYRDVSGVKMPSRWITTWTDGRAVTELTDIQVNAPIDGAKFGKPAAPPAGGPAPK